MRKIKEMPFIFRFVEQKTDENEVRNSYERNILYDEKESITMFIQNNSIKVPLIEIDEPMIETLTKTRKQKEGDDFNCNFLEMATKTAKKREEDDFQLFDWYVETKTKTFKRRESDDFVEEDLSR